MASSPEPPSSPIDTPSPSRRSVYAASCPGRQSRGKSPSWFTRGNEGGPIDDQSSTGSEHDSEEEQWPVRPASTARPRPAGGERRRHLNARAREEDAAFQQRVRLAAQTDGWDEDEERERRSILKQIAKRSRKQRTDLEDVQDVTNLLESLRLRQAEQERTEKEAFERREKALWEQIELAIEHEEREAARRAKEEGERLAASRAAQAAAEKRAKEAREAEERLIAKEKETKERVDREQKEEAAREAAKAQEAKRDEEVAARVESQGGGASLKTGAKVEWERWRHEMTRIKTEVLPAVSSNPVWRKQCFQAKRAITPKIGQLTNTRSEIIRITMDIGSTISAARDASPGGETYTWMLNHLCKCLIRQAEQEVTAKQDTAFPLARVVIWLLLEGHTQLGEVLMARLTKKCCWVLGFVPERPVSMDSAEHAKLIGRASPEESSLQFTSRMCGILAFYSACITIKPTMPPSGKALDLNLIPAHFRPSALWTWQARCVTPPMTDHALSPALWATLLEVAGPNLLQVYSRQIVKLWNLLLEQGIRQAKAGFVKDESANAATTRLRLLLEDWSKEGKICNPTPGSEMLLQ
ncbi:Nuclear-export-signal (NES)-containing protein/polyadenylated-RNA export factor [Ceraceosorus bombacis]|uniref:mRNA export factor GLE1 n=1 Tax=Ceraceosorus bombacis TaxID=401625 RepID=A0A0P1BKK2_9BASI|nr:Nuclear-export-signal (NES)-containing protein/polyadenylated-RNA export factor [Ceraceosorus bombacis]